MINDPPSKKGGPYLYAKRIAETDRGRKQLHWYPAASVFNIGKVCPTGQRNSRQTFQSGQNRFQFALLLDGGFIERHRLRGEFYVDGLAVGFIRPFEVRTMAPAVCSCRPAANAH